MIQTVVSCHSSFFLYLSASLLFICLSVNLQVYRYNLFSIWLQCCLFVSTWWKSVCLSPHRSVVYVSTLHIWISPHACQSVFQSACPVFWQPACLAPADSPSDLACSAQMFILTSWFSIQRITPSSSSGIVRNFSSASASGSHSRINSIASLKSSAFKYFKPNE